jgi:hypothetical protein
MSSNDANLEKGTEIARVENVDRTNEAGLDESSGTLSAEVFPGITKETIWAFLVQIPDCEERRCH